MATHPRGDEARKRVRTEEDDIQLNGTDLTPTRQEDQQYLNNRGPATPKRVACTHCRQSKLRCDSPKNPCSRCERLGLTCTKDTGYKRVNKKSKIDELEKHVQQLRDVLGQNCPAVTAPPVSLDNMHEAPLTQAAPTYHIRRPSQASVFESPRETSTVGTTTYCHVSSNSRSLTQESPQVLSQSPFPASQGLPSQGGCRPKALKVRAIESTALGNEQIDALFQIYFENFHPFFPLLDTLRSPDEYYDSCPLLFWILISVASRRYRDDTSLLSHLARAVPKLVWERISDPPLPYDVTQALLVLCMWPFPMTHLWSDASTIFSNIALNAAFHMGLHRPDHVQEFTRNPRSKRPLIQHKTGPLERRKTWAATNIVSQYVSSTVGYPPTGVCFDWSIDRACELGNIHTLTDDLRCHLIIQRFSHNANKVMSDNVSDPLGLPAENQHALLMKVLEHELDTLEGQTWKVLSTIDQIYFRAARLFLEVFHWLGPSSVERRLGVLKSYATASALITQILSAHASFGALSYSPVVYARMLFTSGYLILKVLNSSFSQYVNCEAGATLFHSVVAAIRQYSTEENDVAIRAANILADVWYRRNEALPEKSQEPTLVTRSRLGASLIFDCLWRWKEQCLKAESTANVNPGPTGWPSEKQTEGAETMAQPVDPNTLTFDWDLFDDLSWSWNVDIPLVTET